MQLTKQQILTKRHYWVTNLHHIALPMQVSLRCDEPLPLTNNQNEPLNMLRHMCSIGNPFSGPGVIRLRVQLTPRNTIIGNEDSVSINFTVSSINPEAPGTISDDSNFAIAQLAIVARADISIDDG